MYGLPANAAASAAGILTHPALLAVLANPDGSDPIKRGIFMQEELLCQVLPDPLPDIPDLPPLRPGLSTRARLEQHRADPVCAACHHLFDPLGMAFENYDGIGRWRTIDQGVPVDSSGEVTQGIDLDGRFASGHGAAGQAAGQPGGARLHGPPLGRIRLSRALDGAQPPIAARWSRSRPASGRTAIWSSCWSVIANSEAFRSTQVPASPREATAMSIDEHVVSLGARCWPAGRRRPGAAVPAGHRPAGAGPGRRPGQELPDDHHAQRHRSAGVLAHRRRARLHAVSPILQPLQAHRDKLLIVGPQFESATSRQPVGQHRPALQQDAGDPPGLGGHHRPLGQLAAARPRPATA